jgi:hypothetical protein
METPPERIEREADKVLKDHKIINYVAIIKKVAISGMKSENKYILDKAIKMIKELDTLYESSRPKIISELNKMKV